MVESPVFVKLTPEGIRTPDLLVRSQRENLITPSILSDYTLILTLFDTI